MEVTNNYYVNQGLSVAHKGNHYKAGSRFPAADLNIDEKSFKTLIRDGSIVTGKERNAFTHPEPKEPEAGEVNSDLAEKTKAELLELAESLGLEVDKRMNKDQIIDLIRGATD